jgi:hydroxyacylglutathione hydrolase
MRRAAWALIVFMLLGRCGAHSQPAPESMDFRWDEGAPDCTKSAHPPLEVHRYNAATFILRQNLCATFEAPFLYLLIGSTKALLIDTGDVADPQQMPLAKTVMGLLPGRESSEFPLLVVHTHPHLDHRSGDGQFAHLRKVQLVGFDLESIRQFYKFSDWPNGVSPIDLGGRTLDAIATPGHSETEVSFYDRNTGLLFTGDFLMPARLLIDDAKADLASAEQLAAFVKNRPVSYVLGGHIEMNAQGEMYPWEAQYHPNEHALQMTKDDVLRLPAVVRGFNGVYNKNGTFVLMNSTRILIALPVLVLALLLCLILVAVHYVRRRRARRPQTSRSS